jgi:hypothetical protein
MLRSPAAEGASVDNVAAEALTVADLAALAQGETPAGGASCSFRTSFSYRHRVADYLRQAP